MYLLAISGGPDSMYLLNKYKNKKIVVAHVNYNKRKDSIIDQKIVEDFCIKHNIKYEIKAIKQVPTNNFQDWARKERYSFFKEIYKKYNAQLLLTAHHKDDFIETALMQQQSGRTPRFFGIKEKNHLFGMNIYRPLVNRIFKEEILKYLDKNEIRFATDSSNSKPIYERNKIRIELSKKTLKQKQDIYEWFIMSNKILKKKFRTIDRKVEKLIKDSSLKNWRKIKIRKVEIAYELLHKVFGDIKLSTKKINSFWDFINGKEGNKKFIIDKDKSVEKIKGEIVYNNKNNI